MSKSILPKTSTAFEKQLENVTNFGDLPINTLRDFINPDAVYAKFLPWLAFRFGVEIWQDDWSEEQKRAVIKDAIRLQRMKGTAGGIKAYVSLMGSKVNQILTPPKQSFWRAANEPNTHKSAFLNHTRFDMPAYRAELAIDLCAKGAKSQTYLNRSTFGYSFLGQHNDAPIQAVNRALSLSKAVRDRLLITWQTGRALRFYDHIKFNGKTKFNTRAKFLLE